MGLSSGSCDHDGRGRRRYIWTSDCLNLKASCVSIRVCDEMLESLECFNRLTERGSAAVVQLRDFS